MVRTFSTADGLTPVDFAYCGLHHLVAARLLFDSDPCHYDSAGYLAHIGVELLLKSWLLQVAGHFEGIHNLCSLYSQLESKFAAPMLDNKQRKALMLLDQYEELRYPNPKKPIEVGDEDWPIIDAVADFICQSVPAEILDELEKSLPGRKAGRVLMRKKVENPK